MKRLTWLRCSALLACGLALGGQVLAAPPKTRPNIVVMLADDWGFSDVGSFGGEIATPAIDALAKQGMRFSNFHVAASCSPTRAMLLTGVDNHRNGVGNMRESIPQAHVGKPGYLSVLDTNVVTVANLLRDSGYHTYASGKWHVGKAEPVERRAHAHDHVVEDKLPFGTHLDLASVFLQSPGEQAAMGRQSRADKVVRGQIVRR